MDGGEESRASTAIKSATPWNENGKLKHLLADRSRDKLMLQDGAVK